jgi:hypothetical protein
LSACGIQVAASSIWRFYNRHGISSTAQVHHPALEARLAALTPQPRRSIERAQNKAPVARRRWPRRPEPSRRRSGVVSERRRQSTQLALDFEPDPASETIQNNAAVFVQIVYQATGGGCCHTRSGGTSACRPTRSCSTAPYGSPSMAAIRSARRAGQSGNCGGIPTATSAASSRRCPVSGHATGAASPHSLPGSPNGGQTPGLYDQGKESRCRLSRFFADT